MSPPEASAPAHQATAVGVALAGGASRRMGRDKARLLLGGATLVERAAGRLREVTADVLVADRARELAPGYSSIPDGDAGGPAAGILGAARVRPGRDLLVLACDLPAVPASLLRRLAGPVAEDAFVPRWSRGIEPLCALYRPAALAALAAAARAGRFALHSLFQSESLRVRYLEGRELEAFGSPEQIFLNLNRPQDLAGLPGLPCGEGRPKVD